MRNSLVFLVGTLCAAGTLQAAPTTQFPSKQSAQGSPNLSPDQAVMTAAPNAEIPRFDRDSVDVRKDSMLFPLHVENSVAARAKFGRCGQPTLFSNGRDIARSSNRFTDPALDGNTAFVCHTIKF